jgi:hypothetical protein
MSYRVEQNKIVEKGTNLVVYKSDIVDDVTRIWGTLNLGGGFNGFTPTFFCEEFTISKTKKSPDELTTS